MGSGLGLGLGLASLRLEQRRRHVEEVERVHREHGLSKVRLTRVRSRPAWGLLGWGSSPVWHTSSSSTMALRSRGSACTVKGGGITVKGGGITVKGGGIGGFGGG